MMRSREGAEWWCCSGDRAIAGEATAEVEVGDRAWAEQRCWTVSTTCGAAGTEEKQLGQRSEACRVEQLRWSRQQAMNQREELRHHSLYFPGAYSLIKLN